MKAIERFQRDTKREWYVRVAAVARLATVLQAEIERAEAESLDDDAEEVWSCMPESGRVRAYTAAEAVIVAAASGDEESLEVLAVEHGPGFVMVARQVAGWFGMLDTAGAAS